MSSLQDVLTVHQRPRALTPKVCSVLNRDTAIDEADSVVATGVNDGGGSQITLPDGGSGNQPSCAQGAPTQASEDENGTTCECVPL